jgi:hypothetical protein
MTESAREMEGDVHERLIALCGEGDEQARRANYREAIAEYNAAWTLIPEPKYEWNASTWVLAAIADAAFLGGYHVTAREALDYVMRCPDAIGNPFLHLRRGEVLYLQSELDAAADELMRAYMEAGPEIFANEDPKYLQFLGTRAHF